MLGYEATTSGIHDQPVGVVLVALARGERMPLFDPVAALAPAGSVLPMKKWLRGGIRAHFVLQEAMALFALMEGAHLLGPPRG